LKTKIITLESHDDLISVRDKLSWAKTPRILLVWPKYEKVALRLLDLKVLQRHADSLGAQLGLVTRRLKVRRDAESLGIPVFKTAASAQRDVWPESAPRQQRIPKPPQRNLRELRDDVYIKEPAWRTSLTGRVSTFSIGVLAVLVMAGIFIPRAEVTLYPEQQTQIISIPVIASPDFESVSITGNIPANVSSVTVGTEQSMAVTGEITIPNTKARGVVRFVNLGSDEIKIPLGTIVSTPDLIRFTTINETRLPGGTDEFVEVRVEALEGGEEGIVDADTITVVEGQLAALMTVSNPEATTGGTDFKAVGPSETDRAKLRNIVLDNLSVEAETQMRLQLGAGDFLLKDTFEVIEVLQEVYSPPEGGEGKTLVLKMEVEFSAHYIANDDLQQLANSTLGSVVVRGYIPSGDTTFRLLTEPLIDSNGNAHFDLEVTQYSLREVDPLKVFLAVRSSTPSNAQAILQKEFSLRDETQIQIRPSWWKWMPLIPFNLSVELK